MAKKKKTRFQRVLQVIFVLFALGFVVSAVGVGFTLYQSNKEDAAFEDLRQVAPETKTAAKPIDPQEAYAQLKGMNADYDGWLNIPGTHVDYPVMATPAEPEYYLRRAFDKSASGSGTPFLGEGCTQTSDCMIIYGHDMDNGTMFGDLTLYEDSNFRTKYPLVSYYTKEGVHTYEIFAAVKTQILPQGAAGYRYYNAAGDLTPEAFKELIGWLKSNALYESGVTPIVGEQIVILSTCDSFAENGRFLVAARRVG